MTHHVRPDSRFGGRHGFVLTEELNAAHAARRSRLDSTDSRQYGLSNESWTTRFDRYAGCSSRSWAYKKDRPKILWSRKLRRDIFEIESSDGGVERRHLPCQMIWLGLKVDCILIRN